jgi:hypothetical protein
MKILCLCQKGNSRSVALAWYLKQKHQIKHEAIAAGMVTTSRSTRKMLYEWAELVILMVPRYRHWIPSEYDSKIVECDVGTDIYFRGFDKNLIKKITEFIKNEHRI